MKAQVLWAGALALLRNALGQALAGGGRIVVLQASVGGGKTHLVRTFQDQAAAAGAAVVRAAATETARAIPLGVIRQLLAHTRPRSGRGHSSGTAERAVLPAPDDEATGDGLHDACSSLLSLAERRPAVMVIEDVHHIDPASLWCLSYLMRRIRTRPMLVVSIASRSHSPAATLA